jgi:type IV pilus assembly protein PilC
MKSSAATLQFCELLLVLLEGKTKLMEALNILARDGIERPVRDSAVSLLGLMKKGKGFSECLRSIKNGKVAFDPLYISLITAAEATGNIEAVLKRIVIDLQRKRRAKENVVNILIYPAIIVLLAICGTIAIVLKGMPLFITRGLLSADAVSEAKAGICFAGMVLLSGGAALFMLYFKIFGKDSPEFRIFYLLDFLMRSNVSLLESLSHCIINMAGNKHAGALIRIKKDISAGVAFSTAFAKIKYFSPYVLGWLQVADLHGNLSDICCSIRDYYARKDERLREIAAKLIEPAVIVLTGLYVLIIMVTVILPILTYTGAVL